MYKIKLFSPFQSYSMYLIGHGKTSFIKLFSYMQIQKVTPVSYNDENVACNNNINPKGFRRHCESQRTRP